MRRACMLSAILLVTGCASAPPKTPSAEVPPVVGAAPAAPAADTADTAPAADTSGKILYTWTQAVPGGTRFPGATVALARAVVEGEGQPCPKIVLDGQAGVAMTARPNPMPGYANYPVTVCEHPAVLPDGRPATRAQVADRVLPLLGTTPARIAVIGDTGCRDNSKQSCDPASWPFEAISKAIARQQSPTLLVHVGDYRYRQDTAPCATGCDSDLDDNWGSWEKDFFKPVNELLQVAPWVMVRGNHEDCELSSTNGNGRGWFFLLDPSSPLLGTAVPTCAAPKVPTYTQPWAVDVTLGGGAIQRLIVVDTADAPDSGPTPAQVQEYTAQLKTVAELSASRPSWIATHRPIWAVASQACGEPAATMNATLQQASGNSLPPGIALTFAGHLHLFQTVSFQGQSPVVVAGMSGIDLVSTPVKGKSEGTFTTAIGTGSAKVGFTDQHGFLMLAWEPGSKSWQTTLFSVNGDKSRTCRFGEGSFDCGFPAVDPCKE